MTRVRQIVDERDAVEPRTRRAFAGVARAGGGSWTESVVIDGDGSGRSREQARSEDTEPSWEALSAAW